MPRQVRSRPYQCTDSPSKIDDPKRALDVALIDSYQGPEITYGHLSKESKRIADILESSLDPSVQSIGKKIARTMLL